mgnify:CR=1 FL=1
MTRPPAYMKINLSNPDQFLSGEFKLYYQIYQNQIQQIKQLQQTSGRTAKSQARIDALIEAKEHNAVLLYDIVKAIRPRVNLDYLFSQSNFDTGRGSNNTYAYLKDFRYLRRDWCGLPAGEKQVEVIAGALKAQCAKHAVDLEAALFLGAGLGRIAFEHNDLFKKVYALDKSFSMVHHFNRLLQGDITFYEINELNIMKPEDATQQHPASLNYASPEALAHKDRFEYFVGDAMALSFAKHSLSCITSVFFTDVIALKLYLEEVKRVLKPGGLYIHFGPLDYFFSDRSEMLSAEEIKDDFVANGFETVHEEMIELPHMSSELFMSKRVYRNWFFVARKVSEVVGQFDPKAVYEINPPIYLQEKRLLGSEEVVEKELVNDQGEAFAGAGSIESLLAFLNGKDTMEVVLEKIRQDYDLETKDVEQIRGIFEMLFEKKFIQRQ